MHLKRLTTPKSWSINRKERVFTTRPSPKGKLENTLPLVVVIRDVLGIAKTAKEVQTILNERKVKVNGKVRLSKNFPVTIFDVVELPDAKKTYQLTFDLNGKLAAEEVSQDFRLCRIEKKTVLKGAKLQINLFDGSNVLAEKGKFKTGDVLRLTLKDSKIKDSIEMKTGSEALVIKGRHRGKTGKIKEIKEKYTPKEVILTAKDEEIRTRLNNIYLTK